MFLSWKCLIIQWKFFPLSCSDLPDYNDSERNFFSPPFDSNWTWSSLQQLQTQPSLWLASSVRNLPSCVSHTDSLCGVQRHFSDRCRLCAVTETQCDISIHLEGKHPIGWFLEEWKFFDFQLVCKKKKTLLKHNITVKSFAVNCTLLINQYYLIPNFVCSNVKCCGDL